MIRHFTLFAAICLVVGPANAGETTVYQKDKAFAPGTVTVKVGDDVVFANEDSTTHNVMARSGANAFNLGALAPGKSGKVSFSEPGTVKVTCAIHPKMKMTIQVEK